MVLLTDMSCLLRYLLVWKYSNRIRLYYTLSPQRSLEYEDIQKKRCWLRLHLQLFPFILLHTRWIQKIFPYSKQTIMIQILCNIYYHNIYFHMNASCSQWLSFYFLPYSHHNSACESITETEKAEFVVDVWIYELAEKTVIVQKMKYHF